MNKLSSYLPSLLLSVILTLSLAGSCAATVIVMNLREKSIVELTNENDIDTAILKELSSYYKDKQSTSGIPEDIYMDALNKKYINTCKKDIIRQMFSALESGIDTEANIPENDELENNISSFFSDYIIKNNYKKDANYDKKVDSTINNAYTSVKNYCDVFKLDALGNHHIISKASPIYRMRDIALGVLIAADVFVVIFLFIINRKKKVTVMYWCGISSLIAGAAGTFISAILTFSKYYDSFSIKQPAVFIAYTGLMYKLTEAFMAASIAFAVIGLFLVTVYAFSHDKPEKSK